jgi:26S proteasome regulatory subunit T4
MVYNMSTEDPGSASFAGIGGLSDQIRELREVIELPLLNPELFLRVGIKPPKGVLLYGPPGTGKTLLAKAVANTLSTNFLKVVSSAIVDKYIGESARLIREVSVPCKPRPSFPELTRCLFRCLHMPKNMSRVSFSWTRLML